MKIGILGAGVIARKMAFTLNALEETQCDAIGSRSLEKARKFAEENHVKKAYGSYEELVNDPEIEMIYIASPHSHHYEHAKLCLEHGKHILVEKAFMANAAQAKEVLALTREKGLLAAEAIWTRYLPSRKLIEEVISSGELGEIHMVTANLGYDIRNVERLYKPELAGGALLDVGVYPLNFISMVLGSEMTSMQTSWVPYATGVDAQNMAIFHYPDGKVAMMHSNILGGTEQNGIIYGAKGYLVADDVNHIRNIRIYDNQKKLVREIAVPERINGFEYEVLACVKAIREGKMECAEMPHKETIAMLERMDAMRAEWGMRYPFEE
ncbi:MAG TPA: gfo/Idh/MocA family oxidoreductase [Lachnospiraceae bacterium]|nr:gfo/Idh/MocA family oxidoreductase [Lachnospiraceae bacterium]